MMVSWCLLVGLAAFFAWRWFVVSQHLARALRQTQLQDVRAARRWRVRFHPSGAVLLFLEMHLDDDERGAMATVHLALDPGEEATDLRRRIRQQQEEMVEICLKAGMRIPSMSAAAPGAPRKEGAR